MEEKWSYILVDPKIEITLSLVDSCQPRKEPTSVPGLAPCPKRLLYKPLLQIASRRHGPQRPPPIVQTLPITKSLSAACHGLSGWYEESVPCIGLAVSVQSGPFFLGGDLAVDKASSCRADFNL